MGNLILCGKLCDEANSNISNIEIQKHQKELLISKLLIKIDFLEERIKDLKDDVKTGNKDLQYDLRELKNNLIILTKLIT